MTLKIPSKWIRISRLCLALLRIYVLSPKKSSFKIHNALHARIHFSTHLFLLMIRSLLCTLNDSVVSELRGHGVLDNVNEEDTDVILIGCGGKRVFPKSTLELKLDVYGCDVIVPCLVVPGQGDDLILGTNVIKYLVHRLKNSDRYWELISTASGLNPECDEFLSMMAGV